MYKQGKKIKTTLLYLGGDFEYVNFLPSDTITCGGDKSAHFPGKSLKFGEIK